MAMAMVAGLIDNLNFVGTNGTSALPPIGASTNGESEVSNGVLDGLSSPS